MDDAVPGNAVTDDLVPGEAVPGIVIPGTSGYPSGAADSDEVADRSVLEAVVAVCRDHDEVPAVPPCWMENAWHCQVESKLNNSKLPTVQIGRAHV